MNRSAEHEARLIQASRGALNSRKAVLAGPKLLLLIIKNRSRHLPAGFLFGDTSSRNLFRLVLDLLFLRFHLINQTWSPSPLFDGEFYLDAYPDVRSSRMNAWLHYQRAGWKEMRYPHANINPLVLEARYIADEFNCAVDSYLFQIAPEALSEIIHKPVDRDSLVKFIRNGALTISD